MNAWKRDKYQQEKNRRRNSAIDCVLRAGLAPSAELILSEVLVQVGGAKQLAKLLVQCMFEPAITAEDRKRKGRVSNYLLKTSIRR